jgi:hypothetical protein
MIRNDKVYTLCASTAFINDQIMKTGIRRLYVLMGRYRYYHNNKVSQRNGWEDLTLLDHDKDQCQTAVIVIINLRVPKAGNVC